MYRLNNRREQSLYSVKALNQFHHVVLAQCRNETLISQIISSGCHSELVQDLAEHQSVVRLLPAGCY